MWIVKMRWYKYRQVLVGLVLSQLLPIGSRAGVMHSQLFKYTQQYTARFTKNNNGLTPPKAGPGYLCLTVGPVYLCLTVVIHVHIYRLQPYVRIWITSLCITKFYNLLLRVACRHIFYIWLFFLSTILIQVKHYQTKSYLICITVFSAVHPMLSKVYWNNIYNAFIHF